MAHCKGSCCTKIMSFGVFPPRKTWLFSEEGLCKWNVRHCFPWLQSEEWCGRKRSFSCPTMSTMSSCLPPFPMPSSLQSGSATCTSRSVSSLHIVLSKVASVHCMLPVKPVIVCCFCGHSPGPIDHSWHLCLCSVEWQERWSRVICIYSVLSNSVLCLLAVYLFCWFVLENWGVLISVVVFDFIGKGIPCSVLDEWCKDEPVVHDCLLCVLA